MGGALAAMVASIAVADGREPAPADGRLVFENTPIGEAVKVFNRYNATQLHVADERLARRRISGVFEATRPESFVAFIQTVVKVRVSHDGMETILSSL
jgi:transmembrane sensor